MEWNGGITGVFAGAGAEFEWNENLNICLLETKPFKAKHPIDAHDRTSRVISEELGWDLVYTGHKLRADKPYKITGGRPHFYPYLDKEYDAIILVYYTSYSDVEMLAQFVKKNSKAKLFWLNNEYGNVPNYNFLMEDKRKFSVIAIYSEMPKMLRWKYGKKIDSLHCVNLNALIAKEPNEICDKRYDLLYYGAFRRGRIEYFQKFLKGDMWLSTSTKNFKKFEEYIDFSSDEITNPHKEENLRLFDNGHVKKMIKLKWKEGYETLNYFKYSLYLQDPFSHTFPEHVAQRFYEAGQCNVVLFLDRNSKEFFKAHGKNLDDMYFVNSSEEIMDKKKAYNYDWYYHLEKQKEWHKDNLKEKENALYQIKEIVESVIF